MKSFKEFLKEGKDDDVAYYHRAYRTHTWANEDEGRAHIRRRIESNNEQYKGFFKPTDPETIIPKLKFVKAGKKVRLSQAKLSPPRPHVEVVESHDKYQTSPKVDWNSRDLQDNGTPRDIMREWGRGKGKVVSGYVNSDHIPIPRGAGIKDGYPDEKGGYGWEELHHHGKPPPIKIRIHKSNKVSILDGNHRLAYWRSQGHGYIPVHAIDERD